MYNVCVLTEHRVAPAQESFLTCSSECDRKPMQLSLTLSHFGSHKDVSRSELVHKTQTERKRGRQTDRQAGREIGEQTYVFDLEIRIL